MIKSLLKEKRLLCAVLCVCVTGPDWCGVLNNKKTISFSTGNRKSAYIIQPESCKLCTKEIGIGLVGFGLFFLLFGLLLYFDSVLLAFGNILFLTGLTFIIGLKRTGHFFFQRHKFQGTSFFLGGVSLVLCRWPVIGMLVESYGFVLLFRSFFPMALGFVLSSLRISFLNSFFSSSSSMV